jgi:hypothetical protein
MSNNITREDILNVASTLRVNLTNNELNQVIELYPSEERNDKTATWDLIVEQCIYTLFKNKFVS